MITNKPRRRHRPQTFWEKFWENEHGQVVVWQWPNPFLMTWLGATILSVLLPLNWLERTIGLFGFVAIIIWAVLEAFYGVNYFRRLLGILVLLSIILSRIG